MCLAIPAKIVRIEKDGLATVDILGVTRSISIDLTPQACEGDFVLVHAGFAIEVVDEDFAEETIDLIREFPELAGENLPSSDQINLSNQTDQSDISDKSNQPDQPSTEIRYE